MAATMVPIAYIHPPTIDIIFEFYDELLELLF